MKALFALLGALVGAGAVLGARQVVKPAAAGSPYEKGRQVAINLGCFGCHGPEGRVGTTNYLPDIDEIPSWNRGALVAYVKKPEEVAEWILDGMPERMREDPEEKKRVAEQLIKMPAYRGHLNRDELDALVFYVTAAGTLLPMGEEETPITRGRDIASRMGCFGCHGPEGRARTPNPGSLKGYVPSWDSTDYPELVESPAEFREWVVSGSPERLRKNKAAAFFLERQLLKMPAYGTRLSPEELNDLAAYAEFVRARR